MQDTYSVKLVQRGLITIPHALREAHGMEPGDEMTLLDLGGVFVLVRRRSELDDLADRIGGRLTERGETLASMLEAIREERARYGA
jgi:bifunctional DNA-binding transcriptional regulator/antitoxin component of YhaV-PrlF toxin-antitoxin module